MLTSHSPAAASTGDFTFETAPRIICRDGAASSLGDVARECGITRALVVTDNGVLNSGIIDDALQSFSGSGVSHVVYSAVLPDPPEQTVLDAVQFARDQRVDGVIGLGGGSSLDTAKLVALLAGSDSVLQDIYGVGLARGSRLPLIQIPTTAGTGSEVTSIAIVTTPSSEKKGVVSRLLYPDVAILDATLTLGLPARVSAMTGIDAMVHAIEAYTSRLRKNVLSDSLAVRALQLLSFNLPKVLRDGTDIHARRAMLQGATFAGMAFANAPVAAVHALAYPLGGHFHVPHGLSNALVLLPVLEFNRAAADHLYGELASHVFTEKSGWSTERSANAFVQSMETIVDGLGLERTLREVGVQEHHLEMLAADALKVQRLLVNNPREVTIQDAHNIYRSVF
ncbi:MAG: iron-containing alcohol dehydrogenase [Gemmatimonadaceae bacterium]